MDERIIQLLTVGNTPEAQQHVVSNITVYCVSHRNYGRMCVVMSCLLINSKNTIYE